LFIIGNLGAGKSTIAQALMYHNYDIRTCKDFGASNAVKGFT